MRRSTIPSGWLALVGVTLALVLACGPRRVATPPAAAPDLIVLLPDPDGAPLGGATVSNALGAVDLDSDRASTTARMGEAPAAPRTLDAADVNQLFGDTVSGLPRAPQTFVLYFQFQSNELTNESRQLLPDVLRSVAAHPVPDVVVVGHTDTTGEARANFTRGLERATVVQRLLVGAGLDASLIEMTSHGETDLLTPTPDETNEPRNRRVEIAVR